MQGEYVRLLLKIDLTKQGEEERIVRVLEGVLHNVALRVMLEGKCEPETPVAAFLEKMRARPHMHFVDSV